MHFAGLRGMPRRIYTYQPGRGLEMLNLVESIGALFQAIAVLVLVINVMRWLVAEKWPPMLLGRVDGGMVALLTTT